MRRKAHPQRIIYPMNALASDQALRIARLIYGSEELRGNITVGMYVGGFGGTNRTSIYLLMLQNLPSRKHNTFEIKALMISIIKT